MALLRKSLLLSVLLPLISCSGEGPELILRSDNSPAANTNANIVTVSEQQQQQYDPMTNVVDPVLDPISDAEPVADAEPIAPEWLAIPRINRINAPKIDGVAIDYIEGTTELAGEWQNAVQIDNAGALLGINNFMFGNAGQLLDNSTHHWAAMHDGVYFYLLVISDDAGLHWQDNNETRKPWKDDTVELYFDGNHSRLTTYDGVDDFHFLVNLQSSTGENNNTWRSNRRFFNTDESAPIPADFIFSTGIRKGPLSAEPNRGRKDIYEVRIKISELNIELGKPFGFEIQLNDDDDGGNRDAKWAWTHPVGLDSINDFTWQNPSYMNSVVLQP
jgi:hypothetical protein